MVPAVPAPFPCEIQFIADPVGEPGATGTGCDHDS
jgi:hypothetical protein